MLFRSGVAHPTSMMVDTYGTGKLSNEKLVEIIRSNFDLRPAGIIKMLGLRRPIYKQTVSTSKSLVGSSSIITLAPFLSILAKCTRLRSPPES